MKNKYLKSAVSFMLAGTMLFGLTACSGGAIAEAGSTGKTDKTEETAKSSSSGDTVKVGILHSQSGTMAMAEKPMIEAAQMAIDEINEDGGVLGKQIEYVLEGMMIRMEYTPTQENREFSIKPASVCLIYRPRRANAFNFNLPYDRVYITFQVP